MKFLQACRRLGICLVLADFQPYTGLLRQATKPFMDILAYRFTKSKMVLLRDGQIVEKIDLNIKWDQNTVYFYKLIGKTVLSMNHR